MMIMVATETRKKAGTKEDKKEIGEQEEERHEENMHARAIP